MRRSILGVAFFAALLCGLGSAVMQELAHSQIESYNDQVAFAERVAERCESFPIRDQASCKARGPQLEAVEAFRIETEQLGARAAALQTPGGLIAWSQAWLVTLLGIVAILVAVTLTVAVDLEKKRLTAGWHPQRKSLYPLLAAAGSSLVASCTVAVGAVLGSAIAMLVGRGIWRIDSISSQVEVPGLGVAALTQPTFGAVIGFLAVVSVVTLLAWFTARTIATLLLGVASFGVASLLASVLPPWFPGVSLPATSGMWFHHRGEIVHIWQWPVQPLDEGMPLIDWTALSSTYPDISSTVGALLLIGLSVLVVPLAVRQQLR